MSRINGTADIYSSRLVNLGFIWDWKLHKINLSLYFPANWNFASFSKKIDICTMIALFIFLLFYVFLSIGSYLNLNVLFGLQRFLSGWKENLKKEKKNVPREDLNLKSHVHFLLLE